ncbi:MAG: tRNA (guanosine(37)-N1)-methyltransferase TrmD [Candidatus Omnitrophica bacterium]|nr:tRNA (guanosine(37)-N1)-methyltransferase TrmD [Candidatus Omnitrophota bacterium]
MSLEIDLVTIFPSFFDGPLRESILGKAQKKGLIQIRTHNLRDYTHDRHKTVDDKPFGGGPGMVMKPEPIFECVEKIRKKGGWVIVMDPTGEPFTQKMARSLAKKSQIILIAGHYEGVDHRVHGHLADQLISVGDFITMGGEAPALCVVEAISRLVPGVLGNEQSLVEESFETEGLEYPQYTKPQDFRGFLVPEVLLSGHHEKISKWRAQASRQATIKKRPDLKK